jgi:cytochrome c oxidase subunit 1
MSGYSLPVHPAIAPAGSEAPQRSLLGILHECVVTVDHKRLGILYILYSTLFLLVAGAEALLIRIQLAFPRNHVLSAQVYNRFFTMHGTTMVFLVGMPFLFGFANYIVPLQIGARDMAFPRLNAFTFWLTAFGGLLLYYSSSVAQVCTALATHPTLAGSPTRRLLRALSRQDTQQITGHSP